MRFLSKTALGWCLLFAMATLCRGQSLLELDSLETVHRDSLSRIASLKIRQGVEHLGQNGFAVHLAFVSALKPAKPSLSVGAALSGDVLTGVPYIHLIPTFRYWQRDSLWNYTDASSTKHNFTKTNHEIGFYFQSVFMSDRFSKNNLRLFAGLGPSMHLDIESIIEDIPGKTYGVINTRIRNGIGTVVGIEWPFSDLATLTLTTTYNRLYDWDKLTSTAFALLIGFNI